MYTVKLELRSEVLQFIRRASALVESPIDLPVDEETYLLLKAGVMPKELFRQITGRTHLEYTRELVARHKILESDNYYWANTRDRILPIASQYNVDKPLQGRAIRAPLTITVSGRDKRLLWYAAANSNMSGSRGESVGIFEILRFLRLPNIWRAWRRYRRSRKEPQYPLPEDAK